MEVDIVTYRIRIGLHYCRHNRRKGVNCLNIFEYYVFIRMLLLRASDIELNPGPDSDNDSLLSDSSLETSDIIRNIFSITTMFKVQHEKLISLNLSYQTLMSFPSLKLGLPLT